MSSREVVSPKDGDTFLTVTPKGCLNDSMEELSSHGEDPSKTFNTKESHILSALHVHCRKYTVYTDLTV